MYMVGISDTWGFMGRLFDTPATDNGIDSGRISRSISGVAFWSAVCLPFVQLSLLVGGLDTRRGLAAFAVLFGANVLALVVGHRYRRDSRE
jgi:hypothetical protein